MISSIIYIIVAILIFAILILTHELGHFMAAKLLGVQVNEFAMGMGPCIWKRQRGETQYSIRALPIGGFCAMEGEDENVDNPRAFTSKAPWRRLVILVAGAAMNFLVGLLVLLIFYIVLHVGMKQVIVQPEIVGFMEGSTVCGEDGLQEGDRILKIDGHRILLQDDVTIYLERNTTGVYDITVRRDGKKVVLNDLKMEKQRYVYEDGTQALLYGITFRSERANVGNLLALTGKTSLQFVRLVWQGLADLVSGRYAIKDMSGPVGIVTAIEQQGTHSATPTLGILNVMYLAAFIAVNLAVMNMLPIPALDGGRVFLLIITAVIEAISHKKINPKYEGYIHAAGMVLLLAFMAFVTFQDVWKLFV